MRTPLTDEQKIQVRQWLRKKEYGDCPFASYPKRNPPECENVCVTWFPRTFDAEFCPCAYYSLHTVVQRAREMVRGMNER